MFQGKRWRNTPQSTALSWKIQREVEGLNYFDSFASKKYMSTQKLFLSGSILGITAHNAAIQIGQGAS